MYVDFVPRLAQTREMNDYPTLHTMVKDGPPYEVRHLLIRVDGPSGTVLTRLVSGVRSDIGTGKQYEVEQKANALMEEWGGEGFRGLRDQELAIEDLKSTVTLAMLMGYTVIYDPFSVAVPLARWPGRSGGYQYALKGMTIIASGHGPSAEFVIGDR